MSDLLVDKQGSTTIFTLNRPERMNALGGTIMADLKAGMKEFSADPKQKVAIITGAGDRAFCAGADLKEMAANAESGSSLPLADEADSFGTEATEKPVIAAINGLAIAGGFELSLSCDIRIAVPEAYFGAFEVKRGIIAGYAVNMLPRLVSYGVAADILLAAETLTADRAYQLGIVQQVVERDQLLETALKRAEAIGTHSPSAVWGSKQILRYWRDLQRAEHQKVVAWISHRVFLSEDFLDGPKAFAEKREAKFSDGWPMPKGF